MTEIFTLHLTESSRLVYDPLVSDSEKYVDLLKRDGVHVESRNFEGMIHGFFANVAVTPTSTIALDYCAERIKNLTQ